MVDNVADTEQPDDATTTRPPVPQRNADRRPSQLTIQCFDGFAVAIDGRRIAFPSHVQRLVGYLAVARCTSRSAIAGSLWGETTDEQARGALRTTLWRVHKLAPGLLTTSHHSVRLGREVLVDTEEFVAASHRVLMAPAATGEAILSVPVRWHELLPGWHDDWVGFERERLRQLRLHMLDLRVAALLSQGDLSGALDAAHAAVLTDPLRETSNRALIRVHLASGDTEAARSQMEAYQSGGHFTPRLVQMSLSAAG